MTREELSTWATEAQANAGNPGQFSVLLDNMRTDYHGQLDKISELEAANAKLKTQNDDLILANGKLFIRLDQGKNDSGDTVPPSGQPENKKLTFADLFNEKGELK